jgi:ABC-type cobalt transport system, permease component CbiQ and related transporters
MNSVLNYSAGDTVIHRMNPVVKIFLSLCICVAAFTSNNIIFLLALIALNMLIGAAGNVFRKAFKLLTGLIKVSVFLFVLQLLFCRDGRVLFLFVTDMGVLTALRLVLKLIAACIPLALMLALTQMSDLTNALVKVARMPYKYAFTLSTAIRFIPLFMNEMAGIMEAQTARGVEFDAGGFFKKLRLILPLCVPLLMISVRKIDGTAVAAEVRGFNLRTGSSGYKTYPFRTADIVTLVF